MWTYLPVCLEEIARSSGLNRDKGVLQKILQNKKKLEEARVGCFERTASKHVYYLGWNWSPAQVGCMRQVLGAGALGRPRGIRQRGRCKVISLQLIKINGEKKRSWRKMSISACLQVGQYLETRRFIGQHKVSRGPWAPQLPCKATMSSKLYSSKSDTILIVKKLTQC